VGRAESPRHRELTFEFVDRNNLSRAGNLRALNRREPYAARAENRDRGSRLDFRGPQYRADAGGNAASDQRRAIEWNVLADFHERVLMQQHLLAIGRYI
jgi:hypothetical protein